MKKFVWSFALSIIAVCALTLVTGCGPKAFVKGEYDDVERITT